MADRSYFGFTGKRVPRWLAGTTAAAIVLLGMPALAIAPASAANLPLGGFEIDGNMTLQGSSPAHEDWAGPTLNGIANTASMPVSLPDSGGRTFRTFNTSLDLVNSQGKDTTYLGPSQKESDLVWTQGAGNPTGKSDFGRFASYTYVQDGQVYLNFAFDRGSNVNGTATDGYYFELNQAKNATTSPNTPRTVGDLRIFIYDQGSGVFDPPLFWSWAMKTVNGQPVGYWNPIQAPTDYAIADNTAANVPPTGEIAASGLASWWTPTYNTNANGGLDPESFVEATFNLSNIIAKLGCPSQGFYTLNARSTTGSGGNDQLMDYIAPQSLFIPSFCASLTINKSDESGTALAGAGFSATNEADSSITYTGTTGADGSLTLTGIKPGTYTVRETAAPTGYILLSDNVKSGVSLSWETPTTLGFKDPRGSITWNKTYANAPSTMSTGATFCVYQGTFPGSACTGGVSVTDNASNDLDPALGKIQVGNLAPGAYSVRETAAPVGFQLVPGVTATATIPSTATSADLTLVGSAKVPMVVVPATGSFSNPQTTGALTVEKLDATTHAVVPCPTTPLGCATFDLYQSAGATDDGFSLYTAANPVVVGLDGTKTVTGLPWGHYYFFRETAAPAGYNMPDSTDSVHHLITAAEADSVTKDPTKVAVLSVSDSQGAISTVATTKVLLPGNPISDKVTLTGINNAANGTVTFRLYGPRSTLYTPADATSLGICDSTVAFSSTVKVSGVSGNTWTHDSGSFTPTKVGYYYWQVSYTGDTAGNRDLLGVCGDPKEITEVDKAVSHIQTVASDAALQQDGKSHLPAAQLYDSATLTGLTSDASGTVTFTVYGPYAAGLTTCPAGSPAATFTVNLPTTGDRSTVSLNSYTDTTGGTNGYFVPTTVGTYYWQAVYSGDTKNVGSTEACGSANEDTTVLKAVTTTTTESSQVQDEAASQKLPGVTVGDTATVIGLNTGVAAGGTVTFALYPSSNGVCAANPVYTSDPVNLTDNGDGTGTASVSGVPVLNAGTYFWTATYSGDANNLGSHDSCGEVSETIVVDKATPTIATTATSGQLPDASIHDTATLTGLTPNADLSKKVTFNLFGPTDLTCSAPIFTSSVALSDGTLDNGVWTGTSGSYTATDAGDYHWIASYEGDSNNAAVHGACGDDGETSTVTKATTTIVTQATDGAAPLGVDPASTTTVSDSATVSGLTDDAKGTVTFTLYGPVSDANAANPCLNGEAPLNNVYWTSSAIPLSAVSGGMATALTGPVTVSLPADQNLGYFFWVASYSGDGNNLSATGVCPDPTERSTVTRSGVPHLDKSSPTENTTVLPGATIHYVVTLSNTGGLPLTDDLVDTLPAGVTPVDGTYTKDGSAFAPTSVANGVITWADVTVDAGQTVVFAYDVTVNADVVAGTLTNTATWAGQSDHTVHTLLPGVPGLDKSSPTEQGSVANPTGDVNPGGTIHYSILLSNTGGTAITSDLVDTLPAGVTPVTGTFAPSAPTINGATLTWSKVTVAAKSSMEFTFDATVDATTGAGPLVNTATWAEKTDKTTHNVVLVPVVAPNPTLVKTADPASGSTVAQGQVITYTVKVGNTGNGPEVGDLVDTLPVGVVPVDGSYTKDGVTSAPDSVTATTITWKNVTVAAGQTITFTYRVTVTSATGGAQLVNTAKYLGLVKTTTHTLGTIPTTGGELPKTGAPFDPITVALWASLLLALGVMFLVFGRRNDEYEG